MVTIDPHDLQEAQDRDAATKPASAQTQPDTSEEAFLESAGTKIISIDAFQQERMREGHRFAACSDRHGAALTMGAQPSAPAC